MSTLIQAYHNAIAHTKQKVIDDMNEYLGKQETLPAYEQYRSRRGQYIRDIWLHVWLNKADNEVPRKEKKDYLQERGFETEGVDRRLLSKLFRSEIRNHEPFDTAGWLDQKFLHHPHEWQQRYAKARQSFLQEQARQNKLVERARVLEQAAAETEDILTKQEHILYVHLRHHMANRLQHDLHTATRFYPVNPVALEERLMEAGSFHPEQYRTLGDFLSELTGQIQSYTDWGRTQYTYEQYEDAYGAAITDYMYEHVPAILHQELSAAVREAYERVYGSQLTPAALSELADDDIYDLAVHFFDVLGEEYVEDLLAVASTPFSLTEHVKLLQADRTRQAERKAAEAAERKRKKVEERRVLHEIFGQEYSPSMEHNVRYVLHIGETNTGKTHHALQQMKAAKSGLYLAPLRLLALEVYERLNHDGVPCSLKTGEEEKLEPGAQHIACTVEMFYEKDFYDVVVIDEAQMIADQDRGFSWYRAITKAKAHEVHIIGSRNIKQMLLQLLGDAEYELREYSRDIPLQVEQTEFRLGHAAKGDALVCFSRKEVLETAARLKRNKHAVSMIYGSMPPETRKKQMRQFAAGETDIIVATDAIGMGLNLPIRRVVFLQNEKFDGTRRRRLTSQEVKQIAGRAGRKGIYNVGKVAFTADIGGMTRLLEQEDQQVMTFAIAPTAGVFERFQRYHRDLGTFFELWDKFVSPKGTEKATLAQERELYELIKGTEIEFRLPMMDLYGFLHLPFSTKDRGMTEQWLTTLIAIINGTELPEPRVKTRTLEDLELSYKAIGLHLLFLYRLGRATEALYWERLRTEISDGVHEQLQTETKPSGQSCRRCGKKLPAEHAYSICDQCHASGSRNSRYAGRYRGKQSRR